MSATTETGTVTTRIPARLDRLRGNSGSQSARPAAYSASAQAGSGTVPPGPEPAVRSTHRAWSAPQPRRAGPRPWPIKPSTTRSSRSPRLSPSGPTGREDLERIVGGRAWGPGRFGKALREAARESRAQSLPDHIYAPPGRPAAPGEEGGTAANPREDGGDG